MTCLLFPCFLINVQCILFLILLITHVETLRYFSFKLVDYRFLNVFKIHE